MLEKNFKEVPIPPTAEASGFPRNVFHELKKPIELDRILYSMFYYFSKIEQNGHIAGMTGELEGNELNLKSINDIVDFLYSTETYTRYISILNAAKNTCQQKDPETQNLIIRHAEKVSNYKFPDYPSYVKFITNKCREVRRKFNSMIPKIAYNYFSRNGSMYNRDYHIS